MELLKLEYEYGKLVDIVLDNKEVEVFFIIVIGDENSGGDFIGNYWFKIVNGELLSNVDFYDENNDYEMDLDWLDEVINNWLESEYGVLLYGRKS